MGDPYYQDDLVTLHHGDALELAREMPTGSVQTIVTSPPYFGLRDYGEDRQIGAEKTLQEYVDAVVILFAELRRVLADDGTLWLNLGDSYANDTKWGGSTGGKATKANHGKTGIGRSKVTTGLAGKNLIGIPWRVAFAMQADGWILRSDIVWAKTNPMPESITDRPTRAHEFIFLFSKRPQYYYDAEAVREADGGRSSGNGFNRPESIKRGGPGQYAQWTPGEGRNKRDVWSVSTVPFGEAHFAVYPPELIRPCILAGSRLGDMVLDPFSGSGTTGMVATQEGRRYVGFDLNAEYLDLSLRTRFAQPVLDMTGA